MTSSAVSTVTGQCGVTVTRCFLILQAVMSVEVTIKRVLVCECAGICVRASKHFYPRVRCHRWKHEFHTHIVCVFSGVGPGRDWGRRRELSCFLCEVERGLAPLLRALGGELGDCGQGLSVAENTASCSPASAGLEWRQLCVLSRGETKSRGKHTGASLLGVIAHFTHHSLGLPESGLPVHEWTPCP